MMCCPPTRPYLADGNPPNLPIQELRKGLEMVTTEIIHDGLGNTLYRVARVFPNAASAARAVTALGEINPAGFDGGAVPELAQPELIGERPICEYTPVEAMNELVRESERLGLYDTATVLDALQLSDDDYKNPAEPPRCATGVCGLD